MEVKTNSKLPTEYRKIHNTVSYYVGNHLDKFSKSRNWSVEVWLTEGGSHTNPLISCGMVLNRPGKSSVYAKRLAPNVKKAVSDCSQVIEKSVREEGSFWERHGNKLVAS